MLLATIKQKNGEFDEGKGVENDIHTKSTAAEVDFEGQADVFL
jgi:hypothetical protein